MMPAAHVGMHAYDGATRKPQTLMFCEARQEEEGPVDC